MTRALMILAMRAITIMRNVVAAVDEWMTVPAITTGVIVIMTAVHATTTEEGMVVSHAITSAVTMIDGTELWFIKVSPASGG
jgi:hypothetical protein